MESSYYSPSLLLDMMDGNHQEVRELAIMFFDLGPQMLQEIESNIEQDKLEKAGDIAHKLKSSLRLWQMSELVDLAIFIEQYGRKRTKLEEINSKLSTLKEGFAIALSEMKKDYL